MNKILTKMKTDSLIQRTNEWLTERREVWGEIGEGD